MPMSSPNALLALTDALAQCMPDIDIQLLRATAPASMDQIDVLGWLYEGLNKQQLMEYEEWKEYSGWVPSLKPLKDVVLAGDPAAHIWNVVSNFDVDQLAISASLAQYFYPWMEHINYYLKPYHLKVVSLSPIENAYFFCVRDNNVALDQLEQSLAPFEMGINRHTALGPQETAEYLHALLRGELDLEEDE